jgi:hypothetical protein
MQHDIRPEGSEIVAPWLAEPANNDHQILEPPDSGLTPLTAGTLSFGPRAVNTSTVSGSSEAPEKLDDYSS